MTTLAIQEVRKEVARCTPNLLPCKINHDGSVNATERYWKAETGEDGVQSAYFRGRKLHGRSVKLPDGYRGAVLQTTDKIIPPTQKDRSRMNLEDDDDDDEEEADEPPVETKLVEQVATFDEVMIWGHESIADATEDPYSKGLGEWISFAEAMHSSSENSASSKG